MRLGGQQHYVLEVRMVDVGINPEEPFENYLDNVQKVLGERDAQGTGEYFLIV